jgi:RimJ/RimL family protein N-acetyltransferase
MLGPRLEGRIIVLRPVREEEAGMIAGWLEDMEVTRHLRILLPPSVAGEREWLSARTQDEHHVFWGIEHEGRLVGITSIQGIDWISRHGETGTAIGDRAVWGRGIGTEAMQLRARFAFEMLNLNKLNSGYYEGNQASAEAQRRTGYREVGRRRQELFRNGAWHDMVLTELLREDWERAASGHK